MEGIVRRVIGPVVDAEFEKGELPPINNALLINEKNTYHICNDQ